MVTSKQISRRNFLRGAAVVVGGAALAACATPAAAPAAAPAAGAPAAVATVAEIRISAWGDVTDKQVYDSIVADFHKAQGAAKATVEQYPGGYYDKIQANFAAGASADVVYFQGWSWQPFADRDMLVTLDELIQKDSVAAYWPDIPNYNDNTIWGGKKYMSVADTGAVVMFYSKERFDKAGLPYPTDAWTYADFQNAVEKTSVEDGGVKYYGYAQAGGWNGAYARSLHWIRMDGAMEWDSVMEPKKANFLQEEIVNALQYTVVDTIAKGFCPSPDAIQGGGVTIATGRVAMTVEGPWFLAQMQGPKPTKEGGTPFDVVEPPLGKKGADVTLAEVHGHTIAKSSKAVDAAWALTKFIMTDQGQQRVADGGRMCGTPDLIEKFWVPTAEKIYNFTNAKAFANAMRTGGSPIIAGAGANLDKVSQFAGTPTTVAWDKMVAGTSAKDALTEAQPLLQKILDDYWAKKG